VGAATLTVSAPEEPVVPPSGQGIPGPPRLTYATLPRELELI
jgi:hypothetical protein